MLLINHRHLLQCVLCFALLQCESDSLNYTRFAKVSEKNVDIYIIHIYRQEGAFADWNKGVEKYRYPRKRQAASHGLCVQL